MKVRELLTPENWIKGRYVTDAEGDSVPEAKHPESCKFCLAGALSRCYAIDIDGNGPDHAIYCKVEQYIKDTYNCSSIEAFNDVRAKSFDEIKQVIDTLDV